MSIYDGMRSALVRHIFRSVVADPVQELFIDNAIELGLWGYGKHLRAIRTDCIPVQRFRDSYPVSKELLADIII